MNLPNKLTVVRVILVPILVILYLLPLEANHFLNTTMTFFEQSINYRQILIFFIFAFASYTDYLDGKIARRDNLITTFGKFVDPIADKLLVNTILLLLASDQTISIVYVIIMISRDTIVDAIRFMAAGKSRVLAASFLGKLKTVTQMSAITLLLLNNIPFAWTNLPIDQLMLVVATIISVYSGCDYFNQNKDIILESM